MPKKCVDTLSFYERQKLAEYNLGLISIEVDIIPSQILCEAHKVIDPKFKLRKEIGLSYVRSSRNKVKKS